MTRDDFLLGAWSNLTPFARGLLVFLVIAIALQLANRLGLLRSLRSPIVDALVVVPVLWTSVELAWRTLLMTDCVFGCCLGITAADWPYKYWLAQTIVVLAVVATGTWVLQALTGKKNRLPVPWFGVVAAALSISLDALFFVVLATGA